MATIVSLYNHLTEYLDGGLLNWEDDTVRLVLVNSGYAFSAEHVAFSEASNFELATANGYVVNGKDLADKTKTRTLESTVYDAANVSFTGVNITFRAGILYKVGTVEGVINPLIAHVLYDDTPLDMTTGADISFNSYWGTLGIFKAAIAPEA